MILLSAVLALQDRFGVKSTVTQALKHILDQSCCAETHPAFSSETVGQSPILAAPCMPGNPHPLGKLNQSDSQAPSLPTESEYLWETHNPMVFQPVW